MRKLLYVPLIAAFILALLSSCTGGSTKKGELEPLDDKQQVKIKVMYWDEKSFFKEYGNLFKSKFPNVDIEVANMQSMFDPNSDPNKAFDKFMEEQKPDVLMLLSEQYERYGAEGKLFPLDPVIEQDDFKIEGIHPAVLKLLRDKGNGKLYGLSPYFTSGALFYNIDLFKKYGVDLPRDSMSWDEVFELAKRFPADGPPETRIYGFAPDLYMSLENLIFTIGAAQDLKALNTDATQVTINTDSWKKVFETALGAARSKSFYIPTDKDRSEMLGSFDDIYKNNLFIMGRAAMSFKYFWEVQSIIQAKKMLKDVTPVNWGIVTAPVDPNNRNQSSYFDVTNVFSVNSASPHLRASWEFVKYVNSEEFAKINGKSQSGNLLSWTAYNADENGRKMEPFYKLEPRGNSTSEFSNTPVSFFKAYRDIMKSEIEETLADKKTIEEALQSIQDRAQAELIKAKKAEEASSASPSASSSPSAAKP